MKRYRLSSEARDDIDDLWAYIAADNLEAADKLVRAIHDACAALGENPNFGHFRRDITSLHVRFHTVMKHYRGD